MVEMDEVKKVCVFLSRSEKIDIEFGDITFTVEDRRNGKKQILKGVSGKFCSGEMTAIMGPSGAGKTSLLNILTGFHTKGMQGTIRSNGSLQTKRGAKQYKKESCYILQDDQLTPLFTVSEIMNIACDLKLGSNFSYKARALLIDDILETLRLTVCKNTKCQRLSGGQKKRLSIALELIDNPPIMFLDEPTTGLDSASSAQCLSMLHALARGGRTIICTIHQPSATLYEMFDHVYVLAGGHCIYQGGSTNTVPFLAASGLHCPQYHNPADYLLEVANGEYGNFTEYLAERAKDNKWRSILTPTIRIEDEKIANSEKFEEIEVDKGSAIFSQPPSEWTRFWLLLNRSFLQLYRDWTISHLRLVLHIMVGLLLGVTYFNAGTDGSKTVNNLGFLLITLVYLCYTSLMPAVLKFPAELAVLKKERFNNWYKLRTYYVAFLVADIPMQIIFTVAYLSFSYYLSEQPRDLIRFSQFLLICVLTALIASSMGIVLGTTVNPVNGTFFGAILTALMLVVAGFLIFFTHMSKAMYLLSYISYLSYGMEALAYAVYGNNRGALVCPEEVEYCHYRMPDLLLKEIGMDKPNYWVDVAFLVSNVVVLRIIAFCTLRRSLSSSKL